MAPADPAAGPRVASRVGVAAVTAAAVAVCAWLGVWQWDRAHVRAERTVLEAAVPVTDLIAIGQPAGAALGRPVIAEGTWGDGLLLVPGREVDGTPATLLIAELSTIDADGIPASLAVIVGWSPTAATAELPTLPAGAWSGWLRASEGPAPIDRDVAPPRSSTVSTAALAQDWPGPVYSPVLVLDEPVGQWQPLPRPEPASRLNFQSLAYAAEWWIFGLFALVVGTRWVRDNGRTVTAKGDT